MEETFSKLGSSKRIIKRLISEITKKSDVPSWAWIIPMEYTNSDLKRY